jgi:hypothetical protein
MRISLRRRRINAAYGPAEQDEEEVRNDDDEFSLATAGTQSVGEEDQGGNRTTNHVESDLSLFCQRDQVRDGRSLRVPRVAAAVEAKKSKGCVGHTSNNVSLSRSQRLPRTILSSVFSRATLSVLLTLAFATLPMGVYLEW